MVVLGGSSTTPMSVETGRGLRAGWFTVRAEQLYPLLGTSEIALLHRVVQNFQSPRRCLVGDDSRREWERLLEDLPAPWNIRHRSFLLRILAEVLAPEFERLRTEEHALVQNDCHFSKAFEELTIQELQTLGVEKLAAKFKCGRRHLNRLFHRHLGISVAGFRKEARLMKAFCLLREPAVKIMSVAEECGFNHLGLFNSAFKKRFGSTPGEVRKELMAAETPQAVLSSLAARLAPERVAVRQPRRPAMRASVPPAVNGNGKSLHHNPKEGVPGPRSSPSAQGVGV